MKGVDMNSIINRESKRFTETMSKVAMEHYNISSIINTMRMKPCTDLSAPAAVDKNGRGLFNPLLTESLSTEDIKFLIMHEAFHKDNAHRYTRPWFAWQNTLFGELVLKLIEDNKTDLLVHCLE